jgi:hypothetical protein
MNIDRSLFDAPVTPEERRTFKKRFYPKHLFFGMNILSWALFVGIAAMLFYWGFSAYQYSQQQQVAGVSLMVLAIVPLLAIVVGVASFRKRMNRSIKAYQVAVANGMTYELQVKNPVRNGLIFQDTTRNSSFIYDRMFKAGERPFEIGNFYYETGTSRSKTPHYYGYMCITLDRNIPHMVLDATYDDFKLLGLRHSRLAGSFDQDQILKLEGNFNDYFTLYAPKQYETDALYVFTPDLMALLIDEASTFNAEIVDNNLYIYSHIPFVFDKPETFERLMNILETVGAKTLKQTGNYRDSRSETKGEIAAGGRRLKTRISVFTVILIVVIVVGNVLANFDIIDLFFR